MNRIVNRYILKEISIPFLMILFILTFVLLMGRILQLMDLMINKGIDFTDIAKLILYLMPSFLALTIPVSLLVAILIGLGRLSRDNEIIVLKSAGLSLYQLIPPVAFAAVCAFAATSVIGFFLIPYGNVSTRNLLFDIARQKASIGIKERIFNDSFDGFLLYTDEIPPHGDYMKGLFICDNRTMEEPATIIAQKGYLISDPETMQVTLRLKNGSIHTTDSKLENYRKIDFGLYDINLNLSESNRQDNSGPVIKNSREMSLLELIRKSNTPGLGKTVLKDYIIEIHKKFTIPFSCLIFGIIGIPLGITKHRSGKSRGFVIGFTIIMLYYILQLAGEALGETGILSPATGAWMSNVILGIIGIFMLITTARETPFMPSFIRNITVGKRT